MIALLSSLCAISAWSGTLRDDFSDGNIDGWIFITDPGAEATLWNVEDGKLVVTNPSSFGANFVIGADDWKDYSIECDATLHTKLAAWSLIGIELRDQIKAPKEWQGGVWMGYGFRPDKGMGAHILVADDANFLQDVTKPIPFEIGRTYHLKGVVAGNKYQFYIDEELAIKIEDNHFPSGRTDLMVNGAIASLDNVVITGDDVPDMNLSVIPESKLATTWSKLKGAIP